MPPHLLGSLHSPVNILCLRLSNNCKLLACSGFLIGSFNQELEPKVCPAQPWRSGWPSPGRQLAQAVRHPLSSACLPPPTGTWIKILKSLARLCIHKLAVDEQLQGQEKVGGKRHSQHEAMMSCQSDRLYKATAGPA